MRIPIRADVPDFIRLFKKLDVDPSLKVTIMRSLGIRPAFARGVGPSFGAQSYDDFIREMITSGGTLVQTIRPLFPREDYPS